MRAAVFDEVPFSEYELLDSGESEKLERFGAVVLRRPDPQALWSKRRSAAEWADAHLSFERDPDSGGQRGRWLAHARAPDAARGGNPEWKIGWGSIACLIRPTPFKHVGLFPEQATNWHWLRERLGSLGAERPRLLNLFGYTGGASLVAASAGCVVTHVDASRTSLAWAKDNLRASGLGEDALRVVLDDALTFARREVRRRAKYAAIVVDPPHFGRGPKGETWQFEDHAAELVRAVRELAGERALVVLSTYAIGTSALALEELAGELGPGELSAGELALTEAEVPNDRTRRLPCGFCVRWSRGTT